MTRRGNSGAGAAGADLHVHTTHSDGAYSPGEVVRAAAEIVSWSVIATAKSPRAAVHFERLREACE
jgi:histidinol phosphatase-like PHP family hydrolase